MIKKITAVLFSVIFAASAMTSCSSSDSSTASTASSEATVVESATDTEDSSAAEAEVAEASLTIDGEKIDTTDITMLTIDGVDIDFEVYRYYYYYVLRLFNDYYGITLENLAEDTELFDTFKAAIISQFRNDYVSHAFATEYGIEVTDEEKAEMEDGLKEIIATYESEEAFEKAIAQNYLTKDVYMTMLYNAKLYDKVDTELFGENGKLVTSEEDFLKVVENKDEYSRVRHILIPYYCQVEITNEDDKANYESMTLSEKNTAKKNAYAELSDEEKEKAKEEAKKVADDVLKKAKDGKDFDKLITEYGWDAGMEVSTEGYFVNKNSTYVEEFKTTSLELKENEISDLVESESFGWFIIKRLPIDMDYVKENIATLISEYDKPRINALMKEKANDMEIVESDYVKKLTVDSLT
ncbi:MAG: peptidylprolyl isomerase [Ruminococcus sp.]|nr:peptidylprolyl isomerase [Ruminococcus sp.]